MLQFRPVFRREATFEWFALLLWGILLNSQPPALTSYLNALGLGEGYYNSGENGTAVGEIHGKGQFCAVGCILCFGQSISSISEPRHSSNQSCV